jgi:hypothetical protein
MDISTIKATRRIKPPRIVMYGTPKIGKTTFAASIPDNIIMDIEGGSGFHDVARVEKDQLNTYIDFKNWLAQIETGQHAFKVLTIDTVDWLEKLVFTHAAQTHGKQSISDVPYGAGYGTAQDIWRSVLDTLDRIRDTRGMMVLMLAHEQQRKINDPQVGTYDKFTIKLQDKDNGSTSASIIKEWCDAILFVDLETFVQSEKAGGMGQKVNRAMGGERVIHTVEAPAFLAGNRYGLPAQLPFTWAALSGALGEAMNKKEGATDGQSA